MRLFALLAGLCGALLLILPGTATAGTDWSATVVRLPDGNFAIGKPDAPVTLTEYLSYTCPHCAEFVEQSRAPLLKSMVKDGSVRVEMANAVRDPLDAAAAMLARCVGTDRLIAFDDAVFARQGALASAARGVPGMYSRLAIATPADIAAVASGSGLAEVAADSGMDDASIASCLADKASLDALRSRAQGYWKTIDGTPAFAIHGDLTGVHDWAELQPLLRAATAN